jgi:hypothetical protein
MAGTTSPVSGPIQGGEVSLGFALTSSGGLQKFTFTEQPGLIISLDTPLPDEEINRRFIHPLQNLLTFVCDRPQEVEEVSLWREDILIPMPDNPEIRLICARVFPEDENKNAKSVYPHQLLFTLANIVEKFAAFMDRWLQVTTAYADACNIYFALQYGPPVYLDFKFLGVIESLSLYYTRREDGVAHRNQEDKRLTEVLSRLPHSDADWIRSHIWVRPFPPLPTILAKLIGEHAEVMAPLFRTDEQGFIAEVVNTVNYMLRRDPDVGLVASHTEELYRLTARLSILFNSTAL